MSANSDRRTLRTYLSTSGIPPEKFLEALDILNQEIRAVLEAHEAAPSPAPPHVDEGAENDEIRRILEDIKARWARQDRAKSQAAADVPPDAPPDTGRITMETVILRPSSPLRAAPNAPPASPPSAAPKEEGGDMLLETIVKTARERSRAAGAASPKEPSTAAPPAVDDQPTTFLRVGPAAPATPPGTPPSEPSVTPREEDDLAKTVVLRPDQAKGKGKGGGKT